MTEKDNLLIWSAVIIGLTIGAGLLIISNRDYSQSEEPGITVEYPIGNSGENVSYGTDHYFEGTPLTMKFTGLDNSSTYYFYYFTLKDTVTIASFVNKTEVTITFGPDRDASVQHFLMKDDGKLVLIIHMIPTPVQG